MSDETFELNDSSKISFLESLQLQFPNNSKLELTEKCWEFAAGLLAGHNSDCTFWQRSANGAENQINYDSFFE